VPEVFTGRKRLELEDKLVGLQKDYSLSRHVLVVRLDVHSRHILLKQVGTQDRLLVLERQKLRK
jgi:hypothetical protein